MPAAASVHNDQCFIREDIASGQRRTHGRIKQSQRSEPVVQHRRVFDLGQVQAIADLIGVGLDAFTGGSIDGNLRLRPRDVEREIDRRCDAGAELKAFLFSWFELRRTHRNVILAGQRKTHKRVFAPFIRLGLTLGAGGGVAQGNLRPFYRTALRVSYLPC